MPDDAPSILAPPDPAWNPPASGYVPPDVAPAAPPTVPGETVNVSPGAVAPVDQQNPQMTATIPSETAPNNPDVERTYHENLLHRIMRVTADTLAPETTARVHMDKQGNVTLQQDPASTSEKWHSIAAAALGGLASGLQNAQGPGGFGRGIAAGTQYGLQLPQQMQQNMNAEATAEQKQIEANANNALLHQKMATGVFGLRAAGIALNKEESDLINQVGESTKDAESTTLIATGKDMQDVVAHHGKDPDLVKYLNGDPNYKTFATIDGNGNPSISLYKIDPNIQKQKNQTTFKMPVLDADEDGGPLLRWKNVAPNTQPLGELEDSARSVLAQYFDKKTNWEKATKDPNSKLSGDPGVTLAKADELERQGKHEEAEDQRRLAEKQQNYKKEIKATTSISMAPAPSPVGTQAGPTGRNEEYLAKLDPTTRQQVKAIANGDAKMPTAGNRGANMPIRNAVFNYDPTYTDARYTTKQNFKTSGDAQNLSSLTMALGHLENATANSQAVGFAPLLSKNATAADARYNSDIKLFTQEVGKLVKNGVLTQGEYEDLKHGLDSSRPNIRAASLSELTSLLGGRVEGMFQKYRAGSGQDIPVEEFFDKPTQDRLRRYQQIPSTGQPANPNPQGQNPPQNTNPQQTQTPIANDKTWAADGKGNYQHWNGSAWVSATPNWNGTAWVPR